MTIALRVISLMISPRSLSITSRISDIPEIFSSEGELTVVHDGGGF